MKKYIYLFDNIDLKNAEKVMSRFHMQQHNPECDEIVLMITSNGGSVNACLAIYDTIELCNKPVTGIASGACGSAALAILQACDVRQSTKRTKFLAHDTSRTYRNVSYSEAKSLEKAHEFNQQQIMELTVQKSTLTVDALQEMSHTSQIYFAEDALKLKLIDEIL